VSSQRDRDTAFSLEGWKKCAAFGALELPAPAQLRGHGLGITDAMVVMEGLGYGTSATGRRWNGCPDVTGNRLP